MQDLILNPKVNKVDFLKSNQSSVLFYFSKNSLFTDLYTPNEVLCVYSKLLNTLSFEKEIGVTWQE